MNKREFYTRKRLLLQQPRSVYIELYKKRFAFYGLFLLFNLAILAILIWIGLPFNYRTWLIAIVYFIFNCIALTVAYALTHKDIDLLSGDEKYSSSHRRIGSFTDVPMTWVRRVAEATITVITWIIVIIVVIVGITFVWNYIPLRLPRIPRPSLRPSSLSQPHSIDTLGQFVVQPTTYAGKITGERPRQITRGP
jgi:hypothetical protein